MRVENVATGRLVRIPRKMRKRIKKQGSEVTGAIKFSFDPWYVFLTPENGWFMIRKVRM